jgi:predicted nucleotidyltransferase
MTSIVKKLASNGLISPEHDFVSNSVYEVVMGSLAYGVSQETSDMDIYAVCIPNKTMIFPHLEGHILGFGPAPKDFTNYQKHHLLMNEKEYDVNVFSIVKYFTLCAENNPNMIDSLFVPENCIIHSTEVGKHMRENRQPFLSKKVYKKMSGYAFSEFKKIEKGYNPIEGGEREETVKQHGYDTKNAYHTVRLLLEAEQILNEHDLNLQTYKEHLKFIRSGGYTLEELKRWVISKEKDLSTAYANSTLRIDVDYTFLRDLLFSCLNMHFGENVSTINLNDTALSKLEEIKKILNR